MCLFPMIIKNPKAQKSTSALSHLQVPCNKCVKCKKKRLNDWAFRLQQQAKISTNVLYITLTYNEQNINNTRTLSKRDLQLFFKRLRKLHHAKSNDKISYFAVGEYGTQFKRPHYHMLIFNCFAPELIQKAWDKGFDKTEYLRSNAGIKYVLKYITKEKFGGEFQLQSQGLGKNYLTENILKYHQTTVENAYITLEGGIKMSIPRYYKDKIYTYYQKTKVTDYLKARANLTKNIQFNQLSNKNPTFTELELLKLEQLRKNNVTFGKDLYNTVYLQTEIKPKAEGQPQYLPELILSLCEVKEMFNP